MIYILTEIGEYAEDGTTIQSVWQLPNKIDLNKIYNQRVVELAEKLDIEVNPHHVHIIMKKSNNQSYSKLKKILKAVTKQSLLIELGAKQLEFKEIYV